MPNNNQFSKSRIYHTIANIKKEIPINETKLNDYKINCVRDNSYKVLKSNEL